jgi:hypothetical protein
MRGQQERTWTAAEAVAHRQRLAAMTEPGPESSSCSVLSSSLGRAELAASTCGLRLQILALVATGVPICAPAAFSSRVAMSGMSELTERFYLTTH